ncbi:rhamnulokinase [Georgenia daeguensis]
MLAHVSARELAVTEAARFPNTPVRTIDGLHWDVLGLYARTLAGLAEAVRAGDVASAGIDSWAVDYALLRGTRMLGVPFHYRDERTARGVAAVHAVVPPAELFAVNGLQHLPFNTVFQLVVDRLDGVLDAADRFLLVPDLLTYWLTGTAAAERTNASTTGLLDARTGEWSTGLARRLGIPGRVLQPLVDPGADAGPLLPHVAAQLGEGAARLRVTTVGSHDTASAVVAVPATDADVAYISCGTWGLVGVELEHPELSDAGRAAGFTNERGVDGRVRYLHNVMGLWLLSESVRTWEADGGEVDLPGLVRAAGQVADPVPIIDVDDPGFLPPGDMPARITGWCRAHGVEPPATRAAVVRTILASLADAFARTVHRAAELTGRRVRTIHLVGGGARNAVLCRLTAASSGLPVLAGPVEATAMGNALVQARALGFVSGDLEALRALVVATHPPQEFRP